MTEKKRKNRFIRYYEDFYTDVVDYTIGVLQKFAIHNTFMFFLYGLGLSIIEIEMQKFVYGLCFFMSLISLVIFFLMKYHFVKHKNNVVVISNIYLIMFLAMLVLVFFYHPSDTAYTILICTIITTAMTNIMPLYYMPTMQGVFIFELCLYFIQRPLVDAVEVVGYILNNFLITIFAIGINLLYSNMKFKEFKQKHFLQNESYHDPMTKIYNRRYVEQYVEMNLETVETCAMMLIDLDNFKTVNDELGHEKGDEVLCKVSDILRSNFRKTDCVARIGGDEFIILMPQISDRAHVAEKVRNILKEFPIIMKSEDGEISVPVSLSVGVIFTKGNGKNEYEELYSRADSFMYKAKKSGKGCAVMELKNGREKVISV